VNVTDLSLSSLQRTSVSISDKCFTPLFSSLFPLRSSSLKCERFEHKAEVRLRHCFSVILHPHKLKTEKERTMVKLSFWKLFGSFVCQTITFYGYFSS